MDKIMSEEDKTRNYVIELWIERITEFISKLDIDENIKQAVMNNLIQRKSLIESGMLRDPEAFSDGKADMLIEECNLFFQYLEYLLNCKGTEYFDIAIRYALTSNPNMSFIDNLIRFIVITNYNDIEVKGTLSEKGGVFRASLGGFFLCDLHGFTPEEDERFGGKGLHFEQFHSRKNLTHTKVGTLVMRKALESMVKDEKLRDYFLASGMVRKDNIVGKRFYEKFGFSFLGPTGEIVSPRSYDKYNPVKYHAPKVKESYPNLTQEEFDEMMYKRKSYLWIVIPSDQKQAILDRKVEYPYIEYNGERIDCTTSFGITRG